MADLIPEVASEEKSYFESKGEKVVEAEKPVIEGEGEDKVDPLDQPLDADEKPVVEDKKTKTVPHQALHAERENRKKAEAETRKVREESIRLEGRFEALMARLQQPEQAAQQPTIPDAEKDPVAALKWLTEQQQRSEQERQESQRREQQQRQVETQTAQLDNAYSKSWTDFKTEKPDAMGAYQHFVDNLGEYFQALGVSDPKIMNQLIAQEERKIAFQALQTGRNPAELIYNIASKQGYRPEAPKVEETEREPSKDLERKAAAVNASKSLSSVGGAGRDGLPSVREIAAMDDEEYEEFVEKLTPKQRQRLLGE